MPKSKSKQIVRAASSGATPKHPALNRLHPSISARLHKSEEGYRLPDEYSEPTAVATLVDNYTITSDVNGACVFAEVANCHRTTAGTGSSPFTIGSVTMTRQGAAFSAVADLARVVAIKVEVTYIGADLSAAGYLSYLRRRGFGQSLAGTASVDALHQLADRQVAAKEGISIMSGAHSVNSMEKVVGNFANDFMETKQFSHVFAASGLPANTAVFRVRSIRFMEFVPKEGDLHEGALSVEPHDPAAYSVHNTLNALASSVATVSGWAGHLRKVAEIANHAYHMVQPVTPYIVAAARASLSTALTGGRLMLTL